jgi:hypothetical protein
VGHAAKFFKMPCEEQWKGKTHFVTCSPIPLEKSVQVFRVGGGGGGGCKG